MAANTNEIELKICRLCLSKTATFFSLIDTNDAEMLQALTSLQISSTDEISSVMCLKCRLNLKFAYTIQQNMLQAEQRFKNRLSANPIKEDSISEDTFMLIGVKAEVKENVSSALSFMSKTLYCEFCSKSFASHKLLVRHKYNHLRRKCPICDKVITASNLKSHIERHSSSPQICELCGATLKTRDNLRQHMFYSHSASRHKCQFCEKVFKRKINRDVHQKREHLDEATSVCDTCGKKFYSKKNLLTHIKMTHLKLRPYVCDFCGSKFSSKYAMKTHRRQHTNEKPYRCDVCGEGFRQKVSLKSHQKSKHNIVEKHICQCTVCGKGFATKVALYAHQRLH